VRCCSASGQANRAIGIRCDKAEGERGEYNSGLLKGGRMGYGSEPFSEELTPKDKQKLKEMLFGFTQAAQGDAKREIVQKILEQLGSKRAAEIEGLIKDLHGLRKFERFRTQAIFMLAFAYQDGVNFALKEGSALKDRVRLTNLIINIIKSAAEEGAKSTPKPSLGRKR
jgi:hypothetical protein